MSTLDDLQGLVKRTGAVTSSLIGLLLFSLVTAFVSQSIPAQLAYVAGQSQFWTFLTYPFATPGLQEVLFSGVWIWFMGSMLEREIGSQRFLVLWMGITLVGSLSMLTLYTSLSHQANIAGMLVPLSAMTLTWGVRNPKVTVLLMFILPVPGIFFAFLAVATIVFGLGMGPDKLPMVFCLLPLAFAYLFAIDRIPSFGTGRKPNKATWTASEKDDRYFDEVKKREKDRQERERLRRLFEGSLKEEPGDKPDEK